MSSYVIQSFIVVCLGIRFSTQHDSFLIHLKQSHVANHLKLENKIPREESGSDVFCEICESYKFYEASDIQFRNEFHERKVIQHEQSSMSDVCKAIGIFLDVEVSYNENDYDLETDVAYFAKPKMSYSLEKSFLSHRFLKKCTLNYSKKNAHNLDLYIIRGNKARKGNEDFFIAIEVRYLKQNEKKIEEKKVRMRKPELPNFINQETRESQKSQKEEREKNTVSESHGVHETKVWLHQYQLMDYFQFEGKKE